jgi:hypothetical protein
VEMSDEEGFSMKDDEIDHNFAFGQTNVEEFENRVDLKYNERSEEDIDYD